MSTKYQLSDFFGRPDAIRFPHSLTSTSITHIKSRDRRNLRKAAKKKETSEKEYIGNLIKQAKTHLDPYVYPDITGIILGYLQEIGVGCN